MDIIIPVVIVILLFITCSICGYCCKRNKQGIVYGNSGHLLPVAAPPQVTQTTSTTYQSSPYPVMETPRPQQVTAPPAGFAPHAAYPPTTPYPPAPSSGPGYPPASVPPGYHPMPMPMTVPYPPSTPYPPMPMPGAYTAPVPSYPAVAGANQLPPTYAEATQARIVNEAYSQQAPFNPSYN